MPCYCEELTDVEPELYEAVSKKTCGPRWNNKSAEKYTPRSATTLNHGKLLIRRDDYGRSSDRKKIVLVGASNLESQFNERAERWERESSIHSSPGAKFLHKDYISIIAKGEIVVPLILKRLKHSKKDWIWALDHIVDDDQNPPRDIHNFKDAVKAWLEWGRKRYNLN